MNICKGLTKANAKCKRQCKSDYCYQHVNQKPMNKNQKKNKKRRERMKIINLETIKETFECCICLNVIDKNEKTQCNHLVHQGCLQKLYDTTGSLNCPMCRQIHGVKMIECSIKSYDDVYNKYINVLHRNRRQYFREKQFGNWNECNSMISLLVMYQNVILDKTDLRELVMTIDSFCKSSDLNEKNHLYNYLHDLYIELSFY